MNHSRDTLLHIGSSYEEGHSDIELVRHRFALDQTELPDVVAVVRGVDDVGVVEFPRLHQHVVQLRRRRRFTEHGEHKVILHVG